MSYKDFYEDLKSRALEERKSLSPDIVVQWSWHIRVERTIELVSKLIASYDKNPTIVDLGCAGAWLHASLMSNGFSHRYVGCDISLTYLRKNEKTPNSVSVVCDASSLPFKDRSSDIVASFETIEHLPDPVQATKELRRVSRCFLAASVPLEGTGIFQAINRRYDRYAEKKEKALRKYIETVGWDKGLRLIEKKTGAAHINVLTLNRFLTLLNSDAFHVVEIRGAYFYVPKMEKILSVKPLLRVYRFLERHLLSRIRVFLLYLRWLPWPRVGNRYGFVILRRIGKMWRDLI
ncbi:MAG: class I SAM-dependent methyltransferase [Candidatus Thorarchaeota archaeon]|jgi:SAM-dependent methyltransferase